jgi:hypothetical protein
LTTHDLIGGTFRVRDFNGAEWHNVPYGTWAVWDPRHRDPSAPGQTRAPTDVINLYGGPGSGKSTTAAGVFHALKLRGVRAELVTEFAKDLTWEKHQRALEDQLYVFAEQFRRMYRCAGQVDVLVTDSPLPLSLVYKVPDYPLNLERVVLEAHQCFNNYDFLLNRVKPFAQYGRNQNEEQARAIDRNIRKVLLTHNIKADTLDGDEAAAPYIVEKYLRHRQH